MEAEYERIIERKYSTSSADISDADLPLVSKEDRFVFGPPRRSRHVACVLKILQKPGLLIAANLVLFAFALASLWMAWSHAHASAKENLKKVYWPSELFDMVDIKLAPQYGAAQSRYSEVDHPVWSQPPSPEVDEAWRRVSGGLTVPIRKSEFTKMRKDPAQHVALPEKYWVDGEETYIGKWSALHNIHCLNSLRKSLYTDYYFPNGTQDTPVQNLQHLNHCVMVLYEALTCMPDMTLYPYRWKEVLTRPVTSTNMWHQCVNFDSLLDQYNAVALPDFHSDSMQKPAGAYEWSLVKEDWEDIAEYAGVHRDDLMGSGWFDMSFDELKKHFPDIIGR